MKFISTIQKFLYSSTDIIETCFHYEVNPEQKEVEKFIDCIPTYKFNPSINALSDTFFNLINFYKVSDIDFIIDKHLHLKKSEDSTKKIRVLTEMKSEYNRIANKKMNDENLKKNILNDNFYIIKSYVDEFNSTINSKIEFERTQNNILQINLGTDNSNTEEDNNEEYQLNLSNYKSVKDNDMSLSLSQATDEEIKTVKRYQEFVTLAYNSRPYPRIPKKKLLRLLLSLTSIDLNKKELVVLINDSKAKEFDKIKDTDPLEWQLYKDSLKFTHK